MTDITTIIINRGAPGAPGAPGEPGAQGPQGVPGYTTRRLVTASRALAASDANCILECTAPNIRLTVNISLPGDFKCQVIPYGFTSVGRTGTATVNRTAATQVRPADSNGAFEIVRNQDAASTSNFTVNGTDAMPLGNPLVPPAVDALAANQTSSTEWADVDWGPNTWPEAALSNQILKQDCNISIPSTAAPTGGYPVVVYFHATGSTKQIAGTVIDLAVRQAALAAGYAFAAPEFRHPVANKQEGTPHLDAGRFLQWLRSMHKALNLDRSQVYVACRSRGNLVFWQALQQDLADPYAPSYAGRQSSLVQGIWSISGQSTYSSKQFGELYILPGDRAAALVAEPNDPLCGSALDSVATAPSIPPIVMIHEENYANTQVSLATIQAADAGGKHWPDQGITMREAILARYPDRIVAYDEQTGNSDAEVFEQYADMIPWFDYIRAGYSAVEAAAIVRARRKNAAMYYINDTVTGLTVGSDGSGGTPAVGTTIGAIVDGQYGLANRLLGTSALGYGAAQGNAANRPTRVAQGNGKGAISFDANDAMFAQIPNSGGASVQGYAYATDGTEILSAATSFNTATVRFGDTALSNKILAMILVRVGGTLNAQDRKPLRSFVRYLTGVTSLTNY